MRPRFRLVVPLFLLSCSLATLVTGQSLAQVADKEKQRRGVSGDDSEADKANDLNNGVIDEYALAGYKTVELESAEPAPVVSAGDGDTETAVESDGTVGKAAGSSEEARILALEHKMKRSCAASPNGIVCASLRQKIRDQKAEKASHPPSPRP